MPSTRREIPEIYNFIECTSDIVTERTGETTASNAEEITNISEELSKRKNELSSDSQKEGNVNGDLGELENSEAINLQTSELASLNTVELDSTTPVAQVEIDNGTEVKNDEDQFESSSKVESEAIDTNQKLAQHDISSKTNEAKDAKSSTVAGTVTENSKQRSSEEAVVNENEVENAVAQVTQANKEVKSSQMYPKLDSIARETGTCI